MVRSLGQCKELLALVITSVCFLSVALADNQETLENKVQKVVSLPKAIEASTPLKDALDVLAERWNLNIQVESKLFRKKGMANVEGQPVSVPRLRDVRLATLLDLVASQVDGSCMIWKERLVIVPRSHARGAKGAGYQPMPFATTKENAELRSKLDKQISLPKESDPRPEFGDALHALAEQYELNIVIDERAFKAARGKEVAKRRVELSGLPPMPLGKLLEKVCAQAKSSYRLTENIIWIVPQKS
ncbi:MAG TPA: hypothetical protein VK395_09815 [Gemmataceae bacterium]|nr:hypothetical protein [Gemmataceae bacterium]